jgi:hypothetical protein
VFRGIRKASERSASRDPGIDRTGNDAQLEQLLAQDDVDLGLRFYTVDHRDISNESAEEVRAVAELIARSRGARRPQAAE